ncbi:MAG: alpha/beta hydrolase family protein, partial [Candidatus Hodarchaeales archaeon]
MPEQKKSQSSYILILVLLIFSGTGLISIFLLNTNYGTVDVSLIKIPNKNLYLSGLLYKPMDVSGDKPLPTVICAHGVSNSKQAVSGLALELGRRGFIALALDLAGHGNSDPAKDDSSLGILSAIDYLNSLPYADTSTIGVVGHSMGAFATWATALAHGNITASVLIGGLPDLRENGSNSGKYNSTFPKNILVAVGEYDEFYGDVKSLNTELMELFGTTNPVVPNHAFYGSFQPGRQDARRLVISNTVHILEPIDPLIITETIQWMQTALKIDGYLDDYYIPHENLIYTYRDIMSLITLISIICLLLSPVPILYAKNAFKVEKETHELDFEKPLLKRTSIVWGCLVIGLYFPVMLIGTFIPVPPM